MNGLAGDSWSLDRRRFFFFFLYIHLHSSRPILSGNLEVTTQINLSGFNTDNFISLEVPILISFPLKVKAILGKYPPITPSRPEFVLGEIFVSNPFIEILL